LKKQSQKEIYFNDSEPRQLNKIDFDEQIINYDNTSKFKNEYSLKNSESQIIGQTQFMNKLPYK
jgi:hypothetical protein